MFCSAWMPVFSTATVASVRCWIIRKKKSSHLVWLASLTQRIGERDFELGSRLLNGEIPNYTIEKRYVRKGGMVFWGQLTVSMMHDAEGKPTTVIGMVEDISERKRAEEATA